MAFRGISVRLYLQGDMWKNNNLRSKMEQERKKSMKNKLKKLMAVLTVTSLTLCLAACSSSDNGTNNEGNTAGKKDSDGVREAHSAIDLTPESAEAVNVVIADNDQFTTCDDFDNFSLINKLLERCWADPIMELDYSTGEYNGVVAESWEWDDSALNLTVKIRDGITFSNGDELKAEDVAFSYERIVTDEEIVNTARWKKLKGTEASDDSTVILHFTDIMPNFNAEAIFVPIIDKSAYDADPDHYFDAPIGSGPYVWYSTDFVNNTGTLQRRDEWWGYEFYGTEPSNVDFITYRKVDEDTTRVSSLRTGEVDIARSVPTDQVETLKSEGLQIQQTDIARNTFLVVNCSGNSPFKDIKMREALSLCIDRQLLIDSIVGAGTPSRYPVPANCTGYNDEAKELKYDPERAAKLLKEAGYNGETIVLDIASGIVPRGTEVAQAIQSMAAEAGFNIEINQMESAAYNEARFGGDYTLQLCNFINTAGESFITMDELLGKTDMFASGFVDEEVFGFIDEAGKTIEDDARHELQSRAFDKIIENYAPFVFLYDESYSQGLPEGLEGVELYYDMLLELRYMHKN